MNNVRLKGRVALVIVLAVLLVVLTLVTSTFSWFDRPKTLSGNALAYNPTVNCYDGAGVKVSTMRSTTGLEDSYTINGVLKSSHTLNAGVRDYYRTTLTNEETADQYVSLYLSGLKTTAGSGQLCVGVNSPVKSYRNYSVRAATQSGTTAPAVATNKMRLYFQPKNDSAWQGGNYYVCYTTGSTALSVDNNNHTSNGTYLEFTLSPTAGTFFVDIPSNSYQFMISVKDWDENFEHTNVQTCSSISLTSTQSVVCYLENDYSGGYNEAQARHQVVDGANVINKFGSISMRRGNTPVPISFAGGTDYIGTVSYESSDTSVFYLFNGKLYANGVGTAVLTMKTKGDSFKDYSIETTQVTVTADSSATFNMDDAPVLQNIYVPGKSGTDDGVTVIDWFIMNDKNSGGSVTFQFADLYVGV